MRTMLQANLRTKKDNQFIDRQGKTHPPAGVINVLGVGPGDPRLITPRVIETARCCDVLYGGRRNLAVFAGFPQVKIRITGNTDEIADKIKELGSSLTVGILVSGDPGLFSLLSALRRHFPPEKLNVLPGISSLQYFFAALKEPWHDVITRSVHGRDDESLTGIVKENSRVAVFTGPRTPPAAVASSLLENGVQERTVYIGENLSYPSERILSGTLADCLHWEVADLNIMALIRDSD